MIENIKKNDTFQLNNSAKSFQVDKWSFSTRADYEELLLKMHPNSLAGNIWSNETLVKAVQAHWHARGQNGCIFAQAIVSDMAKSGWKQRVYPVTAEGLSGSYREKIDSDIKEDITDQNNEAVSLIFPQITTNTEYAQVLRKLVESDQIKLGNSYVSNDLVGLELRTTLDSGRVNSWIVGFGPFDHMPPTRRAPFFELVIRTKLKPKEQFYLLNSASDVAHLADIPFKARDEIMERIWRSTKIKTASLNSDFLKDKDKSLIRARITCIVPENDWRGE